MSEINPYGELMCCIVCGRDTRSKNGVCGKCGGRGPRYLYAEERKGRRERDPKVISGSPIPERTEDEED